MTVWGNALGGWRRQKRNAKGQFKKGVRKTTTTKSRRNGTTYETTYSRGLLGYTSTTTAYRGAEYRGSAQSVHGLGKTATIDFLYVAPGSRGKGVSQGIVNRQIRSARINGYRPVAASDRSDGGQKFVERNKALGAGISPRSSMSSEEITEIMESIGRSNAIAHRKRYEKASRAKKKTAKKKTGAKAGVVI